MMSPTPGSRPGLYNVVSPVGAGGMGEAYRTRDLKLNRDAATKVLAAPNHPSIRSFIESSFGTADIKMSADHQMLPRLQPGV